MSREKEVKSHPDAPPHERAHPTPPSVDPSTAGDDLMVGARQNPDHALLETFVDIPPGLEELTSVAVNLRSTLVAAPLGPASEDLAASGPSDRQSHPGASASEASVGSPTLPPRYEDRGLLGAGAMGEVRRVRDGVLKRIVAMKLLKPRYSSHEPSRLRFLHEAQVVSQLQHPNILPVYDFGTLDEGTHYFTMAEIRGESLNAYIRRVHARSNEKGWSPCEHGWNLHRLVNALHDVTKAVAYAHEQGVLHRDLKADNVMIGPSGEVLVVDWGLAQLVERGPSPAPEGTVTLSRPFHEAQQVLCGTPLYFAPELARMDSSGPTPTTEVYALGTILYEILVGQLPYTEFDLGGLLQTIGIKGLPGLPTANLDDGDTLAGPESDYVSANGAPLPIDLVTICKRATAFDPRERFQDVRSMMEALGAWLDGSQKREKALALVEQARALDAEIASGGARVHALREQARALARDVKAWAPDGAKQAIWTLEDEAKDLELKIMLLKTQQVQLYRSALVLKADLFEAHLALARYYQAQQRMAEAAGQVNEANRAEMGLKTHTRALPVDSKERTQLQEYLKGHARCVILSHPPHAHARLARFDLHDRRLVLGKPTDLGVLPLVDVQLEIGSYVVTLSARGFHPAKVPIYNRRNDHHDGCDPEGRPAPVRLLPLGTLDAEDCYVPAGWCWLGGDAGTPNSLPAQRVWIDGFVMKKFPVTNGEYVGFLNDLLDRGLRDEALRHAPREQSSSEGQLGVMVYPLDGRFSLPDTPEFDRYPVTRIEWYSARAYAAWLADKTGKPWRLPMEFEWEKAARGVDGRAYPWGEHHEPSWSCMKDSHEGEVRLHPVDSFPTDESLYGVRGTAGNSRDWCLDRFRDEGPPLSNGRLLMPSAEDLADTGFKSTRGGSYGNSASRARSADRDWWFPHRSYVGRGFRLVWSVDPAPAV